MSDATNTHRQNLDELDSLLRQIINNPQPVGKDFEFRLRQLQTTVTATLADATILAQPQGEQGTLRDKLEELNTKLNDVLASVSTSDEQIEKAKLEGREADLKARNAQAVIKAARESLKVSLLLGWNIKT